MKLLFYNWTHLDADQTAGGGGVTVYQRNLLKYLVENSQHELFFFNSGYNYTNLKNQMFITSIPNKISDKIKTFEIVNSPVIAPAQQSIINIRRYIEDRSVYFLLKKFIEDFGGFDVIHFNNLEGLSLEVLKLKEVFPKTKFIYSLHNYFLICNKVDLWQNQITVGGHNCNKTDYRECKDCFYKLNYNAEVLSRRYRSDIAIRRFALLYSQNFPDVDDVNLYRDFEEKNLLYVNRYMDNVLAVSQCVRDIFVKRGLNEQKIKLSYIGTDVADLQKNINCADINTNPFKIIYIGYMNIQKGFYFFLQSLYSIKDDLAKNIVVTIAARYNNVIHKKEIELLNNLKQKFKDVILLNGYNREELSSLLKEQHLGIVPPLWEDNLPQIAIELIAHGVPILCSNRGGASELHDNNPDFTFEAGNIENFIHKIDNIINNRDLLQSYWNKVKKLTTMSDHVKFLEKIYNT